MAAGPKLIPDRPNAHFLLLIVFPHHVPRRVDHGRYAPLIRAIEPSRVVERLPPMPFPEFAVFADLRRLSASRAWVAIISND